MNSRNTRAPASTNSQPSAHCFNKAKAIARVSGCALLEPNGAQSMLIRISGRGERVHPQLVVEVGFGSLPSLALYARARLSVLTAARSRFQKISTDLARSRRFLAPAETIQ